MAGRCPNRREGPGDIRKNLKRPPAEAALPHGKKRRSLNLCRGQRLPSPGWSCKTPVRHELHSPIVESEQNCSSKGSLTRLHRIRSCCDRSGCSFWAICPPLCSQLNRVTGFGNGIRHGPKIETEGKGMLSISFQYPTKGSPRFSLECGQNCSAGCP